MFEVHFGYSGIKANLTKKQRQGYESTNQIRRAFYDEKCERQPRTIKQLVEITHLSPATLSKDMRILVQRGIVEGRVKVIENKLTNVYEYNERAFFPLNSNPAKNSDAVRLLMAWKDDGSEEVFVEPGHFVRGKHKGKWDSQRFRPNQPWNPQVRAHEEAFNQGVGNSVLAVMRSLTLKGTAEITLMRILRELKYDKKQWLPRMRLIMKKLIEDGKVIPSKGSKFRTYSSSF